MGFHDRTVQVVTGAVLGGQALGVQTHVLCDHIVVLTDVADQPVLTTALEGPVFVDGPGRVVLSTALGANHGPICTDNAVVHLAGDLSNKGVLTVVLKVLGENDVHGADIDLGDVVAFASRNKTLQVGQEHVLVVGVQVRACSLHIIARPVLL